MCVAAAGAELGTLQARFAEFAATYPELPLYSTVSRAVAADPACAALLQAAEPGQDRPVLWFAALHDLVLREPGLPASRWYASVGRDRLPTGDPWPDVRRTVLACQDELRGHRLAHHPDQRGEPVRVPRPGLALAVADRPEQPVVLVDGRERRCSSAWTATTSSLTDPAERSLWVTRRHRCAVPVRTARTLHSATAPSRPCRGSSGGLASTVTPSTSATRWRLDGWRPASGRTCPDGSNASRRRSGCCRALRARSSVATWWTTSRG